MTGAQGQIGGKGWQGGCVNDFQQRFRIVLEQELRIPEDTDFRAIAETTMRTAGCCRKLSDDELFEILQECR